MPQYPLLMSAELLESHLDDEHLLIVDLCKRETYQTQHVPGAVHFDYSHIVQVDKPIMGKVPSVQKLIEIFSSLGIDEQTHVLAYDDEGGGKACRFLWTLELAGHTKVSLLDGGIFAWVKNAFPCSQEVKEPVKRDFNLKPNPTVMADLNFIQANLNNEQIQLLDSRSLAEYRGTKAFALKGGHIPGAIHYEWTDAMNRNNNLCVLPINEIEQKLKDLGFSKDKTIVTYCHSHHRSSYTYYVLKLAGFTDIKGYAGSWSEWGNHQDTAVETM